MFLKNRKSINTTPDQAGSSLIAVVGIMAVGVLAVVLIAAALTATFTYSSTSRAGVQAQAAAESGIAVAVVGLNSTTTCQASAGLFESQTVPTYRATIWRSIDGSTWIRGCPLSTTHFVRVISSGTAETGGLVNASASNTRIVEAIFSYGINGPGPATPGAAMYVYSAGQLDTYEVLGVSGEGSDVSIRTGNFSCTGPTIIEGTVRVAQGTANLTNSCQVKNSLFASGAVSMTTLSKVFGDVSSSAGGVTLSNVTTYVGGAIYANGAVTIHGVVGGLIETTGSITLVADASVGGDILAGSTVSVSAPVNGSITTPGDMTFSDTGQVSGNIVIGGTLTFGKLKNAAAVTALKSAGLVTGSIVYGRSGLSTPIPPLAPVVPDWVDVSYVFADWQSEGFQAEILWPSALGCRLGDSSSTSPSGVLYPFYQQLKNLTEATVVDARGCSTVSGHIDLQLKTDVAFIAGDFNFDSINISSADGLMHRIWFVVPDSQPTVAGPQCPRRFGGFTINTPSVISDPIVAMAYAPCAMAINNGTQWRGQYYSGTTLGGGGVRKLEYIPVGIPGSTVGGGSPGTHTYKLGALISRRNRTGNGE